MGLVVALYVLEVAGALTALSVHRYYNRLDALTIRQMVMIWAPAVICLVSAAYIVSSYVRSRRADAREFVFSLLTNLVAVVLILVMGETLVRLFSVRTPAGDSFAGTSLLPKTWDQIRTRNAELLKTAHPDISYFVSDRLLGWTHGQNRSSVDGLYHTSVEGIRSPRAGMTYGTRPASHRIAIVGDSFTFGLEVPFQDSWGAQLETALGSDFAVLNFGVDGYGIDQAYLRNARDVRPWHPAVTIFGFITPDLSRSMSVYTFITYPDWGFPFSKPRFVLEAGMLKLLNAPLLSPSEILEKKSITDLPFVVYDWGYVADEWKWHIYDSSDLVRFVLSRYPRWSIPNPHARAEDVRAINGELLKSFAREAAAERTIPLVVYFPSRGDFTGQDRSAKDGVLAILRQSGTTYLDLTTCFADIGLDRVFIPGRPHYSAEGNAAVARCLLPTVRRALDVR